MISSVRRMWTAAPVATVILAVALTASAVFGVRTVASWVYWNDPAHIDQPIAGWMTPRYVALSWAIPRDVMLDTLSLGDAGPKRRSLNKLADAKGIPVETLISQLELAIAEHRATVDSTEGRK